MDTKEKYGLFIVLEQEGTWDIIWFRDLQTWLLIRITWRAFKIQIFDISHPLGDILGGGDQEDYIY